MGNGNDAQFLSDELVHYQIGKAAHQVAPSSPDVAGIEFRRRPNTINAKVEFGKEAIGRIGTSHLIPLSSGFRLGERVGMNLDGKRFHSAGPAMIRRASSQGTARTDPLSNSEMRRSISSAQAACASASNG